MLGNLFDYGPLGAAEMIPAAPPLLGANGLPYPVPAHLAKSMVFGSDADADDLPYGETGSFGFPVPLLRRNLSLSKNTLASLQTRLSELRAEALHSDLVHRKRLLELESALKMEHIKQEELCLRRGREVSAIERALAKIKEQEEMEIKEQMEVKMQQAKQLTAGLQRPANTRTTTTTTTVTSTSSSALSPSSATASTSTSSSCLLVKRSPGETATGEETGCGVCLSADRDTLVAPCGHVAMCYGCAEAIKKSRNPECPFCRVKMSNIYKLFVV